MDYEEFKTSILKELKTFFREKATVRMDCVLKNNGKKQTAVHILFEDSIGRAVPVIYIDALYKLYERGSMDMEQCVSEIIRERQKYDCNEELEQLADRIRYWEAIKEQVYPILLSTEENQELLENLVSEPFMDLSVVYMIREEATPDGFSSAKISKALLQSYGIAQEQLHEQAMRNLEKDGYQFYDMEQMALTLFLDEDQWDVCEEANELQTGKMYILRNASGLYGAAGILNQKFLQEKIPNVDCYILPSSVHETIFIPDDVGMGQKKYDAIVQEVNATTLEKDERLAGHSYFYDAKTGEIRICE